MSRYLGIDYGEKRIGLSISDITGLIASSLTAIDAEKDVLKELDAVIEKYSIGEIVIGFPKNMNNTIGEKAKTILEFVDILKDHVEIPIHLWDERLTTREATRVLIKADISRKKRKKVVDSMASQLILQGFLDRKNACS